MNTYTKKERNMYLLGLLGQNMIYNIIASGMAFYFRSVIFTPAMAISILMGVARVWDAINDPLIGSMIDADKHKYKRNKFLTYIWAGSIGLIVGGACCFLPFPNAPVFARMIIFIAGYVVWDAFYTVANVPYGKVITSFCGLRSVGSTGDFIIKGENNVITLGGIESPGLSSSPAIADMMVDLLEKAGNGSPFSIEIEFTAAGPKDLAEINQAVADSAAYLKAQGFNF